SGTGTSPPSSSSSRSCGFSGQNRPAAWASPAVQGVHAVGPLLIPPRDARHQCPRNNDSTKSTGPVTDLGGPATADFLLFRCTCRGPSAPVTRAAPRAAPRPTKGGALPWDGAPPGRCYGAPALWC